MIGYRFSSWYVVVDMGIGVDMLMWYNVRVFFDRVYGRRRRRMMRWRFNLGFEVV